MIQNVIGFFMDEKGMAATEYAMIAALLVVGVVGAIDMMGHGAAGAVTSVSSGLETVARP